MATITCGLNDRTTVTTSRRIESRGQCRNVSSELFENPKSTDQVDDEKPCITGRRRYIDSIVEPARYFLKLQNKISRNGFRIVRITRAARGQEQKES